MSSVPVGITSVLKMMSAGSQVSLTAAAFQGGAALTGSLVVPTGVQAALAGGAAAFVGEQLASALRQGASDVKTKAAFEAKCAISEMKKAGAEKRAPETATLAKGMVALVTGTCASAGQTVTLVKESHTEVEETAATAGDMGASTKEMNMPGEETDKSVEGTVAAVQGTDKSTEGTVATIKEMDKSVEGTAVKDQEIGTSTEGALRLFHQSLLIGIGVMIGVKIGILVTLSVGLCPSDRPCPTDGESGPPGEESQPLDGEKAKSVIGKIALAGLFMVAFAVSAGALFSVRWLVNKFKELLEVVTPLMLVFLLQIVVAVSMIIFSPLSDSKITVAGLVTTAVVASAVLTTVGQNGEGIVATAFDLQREGLTVKALWDLLTLQKPTRKTVRQDRLTFIDGMSFSTCLAVALAALMNVDTVGVTMCTLSLVMAAVLTAIAQKGVGVMATAMGAALVMGAGLTLVAGPLGTALGTALASVGGIALGAKLREEKLNSEIQE